MRDLTVRVMEDLPVPHDEPRGMRGNMMSMFMQVNKELWLILTVFLIAFIVNKVVSSQRLMLSFYTLPTLFSAYFFGRRHAIMTAVFSVLVVGSVAYSNPTLFEPAVTAPFDRWFDMAVWSGFLVLTAYAMGTLYESKERHIQEVRTAALLHDIGKLDISRDILYKAAKLSASEFQEMQTHVARGVDFLAPIGGSLRRVLPIILSHHDKFDGTGYSPTAGEEIPIEARIIAVADVYDAIASDRPYRRAVTPFEARQIIVSSAGSNFDPVVVEAFVDAFEHGEMEIPEALVI